MGNRFHHARLRSLGTIPGLGNRFRHRRSGGVLDGNETFPEITVLMATGQNVSLRSRSPCCDVRSYTGGYCFECGTWRTASKTIGEAPDVFDFCNTSFGYRMEYLFEDLHPDLFEDYPSPQLFDFRNPEDGGYEMGNGLESITFRNRRQYKENPT